MWEGIGFQSGHSPSFSTILQYYLLVGQVHYPASILPPLRAGLCIYDSPVVFIQIRKSPFSSLCPNPGSTSILPAVSTLYLLGLTPSYASSSISLLLIS